MLLDQLSTISWITNNGIKTEAGEPIDFSKYRFMYDVYADRSRLICSKKCAQIGFTTYEILKSAHECKNDKIDILYVLPTADDVKRFSGGKTNKIIAHNPSLQSWTKDKDSIEQKQFGQNTIYYQGSWTERAALMITAKKLIVDEYDRCKQEIVEQYDSRLQSVAEPRKAFFSNPSMPDFGIDKWYKKSDQKKWNITHSCGAVFPMTEECVDYNAEIYRCPKCKGEITDEERRMGKWVNKDGIEWKGEIVGNYEWSGYWIPLWIAPWISAKYIAKEKREKTEEYFANFVAGEPYYGSGNKVLPDTVFRNLTRKINDQSGRIIIGSDTGIPNYYVIGNKDGLFYYGQTKDFNTYREYLKRWSNSVIVFDGQGELYEQRKLQEEFPGRVFLCFYRKDRKGQEIIKWGEGKEYGSVAVDRNRAIQLVIDELNQKLIPLQGTESEWNEYASHWFNIYRTKEEDALGKPEYTWERMGADHLVHATVYWRVGMSKYAQGQAEFITEKAEFGETSAFNNVFNAEFI